MNTADLADLIESFAPLSLQESWDNSGYNLDLRNETIRNVLLCLDVTPEIVREACRKSCDVIIAHHPLMFREVRKIDSFTRLGSLIVALARAGISVYCAHTTMDSSPDGLNTYVARMLGLHHIEPLDSVETHRFLKLAVSVPVASTDSVRSAMFDAGAGKLGRYSDCSFTSAGIGTFRPLDGSQPFIGQQGALAQVDEDLIQVLVRADLLDQVINAAIGAHPYEAPAIDVYPLSTVPGSHAGMGAIGDLAEPIKLRRFASIVKDTLRCSDIKFTGEPDSSVRRVALCTGAGVSLIKQAETCDADVFVTGEAKHHNYVESRIPMIAAGHYDTEKWFVNAMRAALQKAGVEVEYKVGICVSNDMKRPYEVI